MKTLLLATTSHDNLSSRGEESLVRMMAGVRAARDQLHRSRLARLVWSWVDDGSTDGTAEWLAARLRPDDGEVLTATEANNWTAVARNLAVARFRSDYVTVFDSDDEMYPAHLVTGISGLEAPDADGLRFGVVATRIDAGVESPIHEQWIDALSIIHVNIRFYRRSVWDFVEGFPSAAIYRHTGCEDQDMANLIAAFFPTHTVREATARYCRYPGNYFDRQKEKFQLPVARGGEFDRLSGRTGVLHGIREKYMQERVRYLKAKLSASDDISAFAGLKTGPAFIELGLGY